ncbi:hypothetical protein [Erwinia sp. V71]|uniref:hypothetical protein n=1 Tax=Erwinia sp. V71 TaxID=3369424 RepID=UPI003F63220B
MKSIADAHFSQKSGIIQSMTPLLACLVFQNPSLTLSNPELIAGLQTWSMFIPAESLRHLVPGLNNDDLRLALLLQALKAGDLSHQIITLVLSSLSDEKYRVFLSPKAHRSVPYSESLIEMAQLLKKSGFIQSLKLNEARQRTRFVPHGSSAFQTSVTFWSQILHAAVNLAVMQVFFSKQLWMP